MSVQHKSLEDEILFVLGRSSSPLTSGAIYERCELADEIAQVSNAIFQLKDAGKIERVAGAGRQRYTLASGVATPAPAGKAGRPTAEPASVQPDPAAAQAAPLAGIKPDLVPGLPKIDIPTLGDPSVKTADDEIAKGLDLVEAQLSSERLADAILARLKHQLAPTLCELQAAAGMDRVNVHIHIEQVDFHLGGL